MCHDFPNVLVTSHLYIVGLYAINVCPFHPLRSARIPFAPAEAARKKSVKNWRDSPPLSIPVCPLLLLTHGLVLF